MLQGNMKNKEIRIHPTQKPVALYRWILQKYAKQGNKILDTHGGSGSIAIACELEGYDLDLCELDTDYFKKLKQRYEDHCKQPRLF
jgi:site-specific DNA-methyltransferase (adenine-specific)